MVNSSVTTLVGFLTLSDCHVITLFIYFNYYNK